MKYSKYLKYLLLLSTIIFSGCVYHPPVVYGHSYSSYSYSTSTTSHYSYPVIWSEHPTIQNNIIIESREILEKD